MIQKHFLKNKKYIISDAFVYLDWIYNSNKGNLISIIIFY